MTEETVTKVKILKLMEYRSNQFDKGSLLLSECTKFSIKSFSVQVSFKWEIEKLPNVGVVTFPILDQRIE